MHTLCSYRDTHSELRNIIEELRAVLTLEQLRLRPNAKSAYARSAQGLCVRCYA
jgi:hypothetical protein